MNQSMAEPFSLMPMKKTTQFRALIQGAEILQLPGCHDALSARILEQTGFKAALWAREDPDFVIMARTDSYGVHGLEEALDRVRRYAGAGADMVFVEAVRTESGVQCGCLPLRVHLHGGKGPARLGTFPQRAWDHRWVS
jgi:2-methylisocitrate lyase-like PEP mutase family enzyme